MSRDLKPTERLVQIGQTALRAPDGSFLPAQPLYIIVEAAPDEPQDKLFSAGEEELLTDVSGIFAKKFAQYVQGAAVIGSLHSLSGNYKKGGFPMTIGEKMTITTWRARQLAYLEEVYSPREHMGKLMSHLGARQVYIQLYNTMRTALNSLSEQPNTYVAMAVYRKLREDMNTLDDMLDQLEDTGLYDPDEYDPDGVEV